MPTFLCSAILFDMDGVLVDSTQAVAREWRRWAEERGVEPAKVEAIMHGRRTMEIVRAVAPHLDAEAEAKRIERRGAEDAGKDGVVVMPGAADLLRSLPPERWAVVTSAMRAIATTRLRLAGLPDPHVIVPADEVGKGKPHPEPYLKGAQLLGVDPKDCLVIEDAPAGIESAHAGGMKAIGITSTYSAAELQAADAVIHTISQIKATPQDGRLRVEVAS